MDYTRIVQMILDVGEEMLRSGAENFRLEDSLYRMCRSYGFRRYDVYAIPSNLQITVETPEGEPELENIEDDDEYEIAADAFDEWMDTQEFEESDEE